MSILVSKHNLLTLNIAIYSYSYLINAPMGSLIYFMELGVSTTLTFRVLVLHRRLFIWIFSPSQQVWPDIWNYNLPYFLHINFTDVTEYFGYFFEGRSKEYSMQEQKVLSKFKTIKCSCSAFILNSENHI